MIDRSAFAKYLADYKRDFIDVTWPEEKYKWQAVHHFQKHWDVNAPEFAAMLEQSLAESKNLLASTGRFPRRMIKHGAESDPERVRAMFVDLFDETKDLFERVDAFKQASGELFDRNGGRSHYQDENSISTYLWLRYPDKYYIYKWSVARDVSRALGAGYGFKMGDVANNVRDHFSLYNELCAELQQDRELRDLLASQLTANCYPDPQMKTLTIDFGYFVSQQAKQAKEEDDPGLSVDDPLALDRSDLDEGVAQAGGVDTAADSAPNHWLLVASPRHFSFSDLQIGEVEHWTLYTETGTKRRIFRNFENVKAGDLVIGYESTPVKQIVALGRFTNASDGKVVPFEKSEGLVSPIDYHEMRDHTELKNMEGLPNIQGSLFRLTPTQYDAIIDLIRDSNPAPKHEVLPRYSKQDFLSEVFTTEEQYDGMVGVLRRKKNIILQGAPGVGKTFAANRLAWSLMGEQDPSRVEFVQFHQNYSYEDFMLGYKPVDDGFKLQEGVFFKFCKKAANRPDRDFFFIIDEINRGNMSKVFGELLMLIENDYRGTKATLAYGGLSFSVPKNVHIIGMMNTADRSLAMIDYALRRRFSFVEMKPGFQTEGFKRYQADLDSEVLDSLLHSVQTLNEQITKDPSLGRGFCIGHSYFCGQQNVDDDWLRAVIDYDILPMLEEYWFDDEAKVSQWRTQLHGILQS